MTTVAPPSALRGTITPEEPPKRKLTVASLLTRTRKLLEVSWCRGRLTSTLPEGQRYCLLGGLAKAAGYTDTQIRTYGYTLFWEDPLLRKTVAQLAARVDPMRRCRDKQEAVYMFNDGKGKDAVIRAIDETKEGIMKGTRRS